MFFVLFYPFSASHSSFLFISSSSAIEVHFNLVFLLLLLSIYFYRHYQNWSFSFHLALKQSGTERYEVGYWPLASADSYALLQLYFLLCLGKPEIFFVENLCGNTFVSGHSRRIILIPSRSCLLCLANLFLFLQRLSFKNCFFWKKYCNVLCLVWK